MVDKTVSGVLGLETLLVSSYNSRDYECTDDSVKRLTCTKPYLQTRS